MIEIPTWLFTAMYVLLCASVIIIMIDGIRIFFLKKARDEKGSNAK